MANLAWEILAKYLNNETSEEENMQVDNWRNESADNEAFFQKMKQVWLESEQELSTANPDTERVWQQLSQKIEPEQSTSSTRTKSVQMFSRPVISRLAAAVLLLVIAGLATWYLTSNNQYLEVTTLSSADSILLPDGSKVYLNANTSLKYARDFESEQREVILEGEAFFEVVKNEEKPFVVKAGEAQIKVLGTRFNLKAPEAANMVSCIVLSGKVSMQAGEQNKMEVILDGGEQGIYENEQLNSQTFQNPNDLSWYTGEFRFQSSTLAEVVRVLENAYHQEISLERPELAHCSLTATFRANNLEEMLQVITITLGLQYEQKENGWLISGEGC